VLHYLGLALCLSLVFELIIPYQAFSLISLQEQQKKIVFPEI
jgi:hypothetical protein